MQDPLPPHYGDELPKKKPRTEDSLNRRPPIVITAKATAAPLQQGSLSTTGRFPGSATLASKNNSATPSSPHRSRPTIQERDEIDLDATVLSPSHNTPGSSNEQNPIKTTPLVRSSVSTATQIIDLTEDDDDGSDHVDLPTQPSGPYNQQNTSRSPSPVPDAVSDDFILDDTCLSPPSSPDIRGTSYLRKINPTHVQAPSSVSSPSHSSTTDVDQNPMVNETSTKQPQSPSSISNPSPTTAVPCTSTSIYDQTPPSNQPASPVHPTPHVPEKRRAPRVPLHEQSNTTMPVPENTPTNAVCPKCKADVHMAPPILTKFRECTQMVVCWHCDAKFAMVACTHCNARYVLQYAPRHQGHDANCNMKGCEKAFVLNFPDPKTIYPEKERRKPGRKKKVDESSSSFSNNATSHIVHPPPVFPSRFREAPFDAIAFERSILVPKVAHHVESSTIRPPPPPAPIASWRSMRYPHRPRPSAMRLFAFGSKITPYRTMHLPRSKLARASYKKMKIQINYDEYSSEEDEAAVEDGGVSDDSMSSDDDEGNLSDLIDDTPLAPDTVRPPIEETANKDHSEFSAWFDKWLHNDSQALVVPSANDIDRARLEALAERVEGGFELTELEWAEFYRLSSAYVDTKNKVRRCDFEERIMWICKNGAPPTVVRPKKVIRHNLFRKKATNAQAPTPTSPRARASPALGAKPHTKHPPAPTDAYFYSAPIVPGGLNNTPAKPSASPVPSTTPPPPLPSTTSVASNSSPAPSYTSSVPLTPGSTPAATQPVVTPTPSGQAPASSQPPARPNMASVRFEDFMYVPQSKPAPSRKRKTAVAPAPVVPTTSVPVPTPAPIPTPPPPTSVPVSQSSSVPAPSVSRFRPVLIPVPAPVVIPTPTPVMDDSWHCNVCDTDIQAVWVDEHLRGPKHTKRLATQKTVSGQV